MLYKNDWPDAKKRLTALWHGEIIDRPCLAVRAPKAGKNQLPAPEPVSAKERWVGVDYLVASARHQLENTWWGGEAIPSFHLQAGWVLCLGGTPVFRDETIWFDKREFSFKQESPFRMGYNDYWARKYSQLLFAIAELAGQDDFLVGSPGSLPANDLLSIQMGTEEFLLALLDQPDWMEKALLDGASDLISIRLQLQEKLKKQHGFWYGNAGWMPFWAPEPFVSTQSDVSCLLSPELFDRFVLPEIDMFGSMYNALWYHLDGCDAKQHLPRLLSLPYLKVMQYVPTLFEPPNGIKHLQFYQAIQAAGKIVHINVAPDQVEPLLRSLDPAKLFMQVYCSSVSEGEYLLEQSALWCGKKQPS